MDNERPIEKLLRRYAKKQREDAGTPPELHPATRRLLQGEVARQFRKERDERTASAESPVRWWPRWVYGLAAFAVVAVMAAMLLPALSKSKSRSMKMASIEGRKDAESAPPILGGEMVKRAAPPVEVTKNEVVESPALDELNRAKSTDDFGAAMTNSTVLAFADVPRLESSMSLGASERGAAFGSATTVMTAASAPAATPLPALHQEDTIRPAGSKGYAPTAEPILTVAGKSKAEGSQYKSGDSVRRDYYNYAQTQVVARFSNMDKSGSKMPVLASFQVEQSGDELRVTDSDGSTYSGNLVTEETLRDTKTEVDYTKLKEKSEVMQKAARAVSESESRQHLSVQNTFFRVAGTNKTLKQQVIFTGNFVAVTNAVQSQLSGIGGSNQAQNFPGQQAFPQLFNNSIIVGRVQLEGNKDIEVNAVPASQ